MMTLGPVDEPRRAAQPLQGFSIFLAVRPDNGARGYG